MVFRAESEFDRVAADRRADGASDGWTGDVALAVVNKADRQECLCHLENRKPKTPSKVSSLLRPSEVASQVTRSLSPPKPDHFA